MSSGNDTCGRPIVVELMGPAGCGKTTLLRELLERGEAIVGGLSPRKRTKIAWGLWHSLRLLPAWLQLPERGRWLSIEELRSMVYLEAWLTKLERRPPAGARVILLDHGPLFRLARLSVSGHPLTGSASFRRWRSRALKRWLRRLDAVVWLDAPDDALLARIESRRQEHAVKGKERSVALAYLARHRAGFAAILAALDGSAGPRLFRHDTGATGPDELAREVLAEIDALSDRNGAGAQPPTTSS